MSGQTFGFICGFAVLVIIAWAQYTIHTFRKDSEPVKPPVAFLGMPTSWTPDCQGKQDFDFEILTASCRYYPSNYRADGRVSTFISICFGGEPMIGTRFVGDTESEVKANSEAWLRNVINQISIAIHNEVRT